MPDDGDKSQPVAPPRRKRSSMLVSPDQQPCGFKELFGNNGSRRSSSESILNDSKRPSNAFTNVNLNENDNFNESIVTVPLPITSSPAAELMANAALQINVPKAENRLQRKVSRVGNKKSDKFFGENLSDCLSDEPVTPEPDCEETTKQESPMKRVEKDSIDEFIEKNVPGVYDGSEDDVDKSKEAEHKAYLDKKAEFLMAMLENQEESLEKSVPVAPKRRHSRPISMEIVDQNEPVEVKMVAAETQATGQNAEKSSKNDDEERYIGLTPVNEPIIVPRRRSKHICDDDEMLRQHLHNNDHEQIETVSTNAEIKPTEISIAEINEQIIVPVKPKRDFSVYENTPIKSQTNENNSHLEDATKEKPVPRKRHLSQGNLLARISSSDEKVSNEIIQQPQQLKKCNSQQSFFSQELMNQMADRVYGFQDPYDIDHNACDDGSTKVAPNSKLTVRKISVVRKDSTNVEPIKEDINETEIPKTTFRCAKTDRNDAIDNSDLLKINEKIFGKMSAKQQTDEFLSAEVSFSCVELKTFSSSDLSRSSTNHSIQSTATTNDTISSSESSQYDSLTSDSTTSVITVREMKIERNNNEIDTVEEKMTPRNKILENVENDAPRRGSITEVDQWFLKHNDSNCERRGSTSSIGYDTRKVFPFGQSDSGAGTKFFDEQNESETNTNETKK